MDILTRTRKIGGSIVVRIPKEVVKEKSIKEGETVKIDVKKIGKEGFGILKKTKPLNKKEKFSGQLDEKK